MKGHPFLGLCLTRLTRTAWEWTKVLVLLSRKETFYLSDRSDSTWLKNRCHLKNSLLDPLQRPFCVAAEGRLGERKIKRTGHAFSFFPPFPARFLFSIAAVFIGITSGSLCGGESHTQLKNVSFRYDMYYSRCKQAEQVHTASLTQLLAFFDPRGM